MRIKTILAVAVTAMAIFSCNDARKSEAFRVLEDVDSYIEARPDSALAVLEGIDKSELTSKELEAKYALLLSQALDKNYIDLQSDSIIAPAVNYYKYHGTDDERFRTLYYAGRVYQNAGDIEAAMEKFVEAEHHISSQIDKTILARLFKAKAVAYQDIFDYRSAITQAHKAAEYYLSDQDSVRYLSTLNSIVILYGQLDDKDAERKYLDILSSNRHLMNESQLNTYYAVLLNSSLSDSQEVVSGILSDYLSTVKDASIIKWLSIADAYIVLDDYLAAVNALDNYILYGGRKDPAFNWISATLYEKLGEYDKALNFYKSYLQQTDEADLLIFESDTKFIEERYQTEIKQIKANFISNIITVSIIILLFIAGMIILLIKKQLLQKTAENMELEIERLKYEKMYSDALAEREILNDIVEKSSVREKTRQVISDRLEVLNKVIISHITDTSRDSRKAYEELEALISDRASFLESTKKTIENINPDFVSYLVSKGLTESEVNLCCLYAIGMKGKDIKDYTATASVYKDSSIIRQKLGLMENDTNLSNYLQDLLKMPSGKLL
ncbi:MAG: hypothetical protein IJ394_06900 [Bacteroidales bacterium]|nr:hypothetical protein [Bacteroidales bacterium]